MKWDKAGQFSAVGFAEAPELPRAPVMDSEGHEERPVVFVVDDDYFARTAVRIMLEDAGLRVREFETGEAFLAGYEPQAECCLVLDLHLPGMGGIDLLRQMDQAAAPPAVVISGASGIAEAVTSMKVGATDFIEKPIREDALLESVRAALRRSKRQDSASHLKEVAVEHLSELTARQRQVLSLVLAGHASKIIAYRLGISQRTVENHRAVIMQKTGATSLPALARLAIAASPYRQDTAA
jgi:two-component system CheB/CheR fusion protein